MEIPFDHTDVPVRDLGDTARFLADFLDIACEPDGPDGEFRRAELGSHLCLFLHEAAQFESRHLTFRVPQSRFDEVVTRLRMAGIAFGNDPEMPVNAETADPLGGKGHVYFFGSERAISRS